MHPADYAATNCAVDKYDIMGFARLFIDELWGGGNERDEAIASSADMSRGSRKTRTLAALVARWEGYTPDGLDPQGGENFGLVPVRLVK